MVIAHITEAQMKAFGAAMRRQFEIDSIAMLRRSYPQTCAKHADDALLLFVRHGIERAKASGMDAVTDVQRWLRLMLRFGPYFDSATDARLAGIRTVLDNVEVYPPLRLDEAEALASQIAPEPS